MSFRIQRKDVFVSRVVDLSLTVQSGMRGVRIETATTLERDGWNATTLCLYSHCGTHMDAPRHFLPDGRTIDQQSLDACVGPARVVNLTPTAPRRLIEVADVQLACGEPLEPGTRILFRTDWYKRHGTPEYRDQLPRISLGLAHWLVERQVVLVGVEPPSVADVNNLAELTQVHQTLFRGNILIVEGLANLDQLRTANVDFIALPLQIAGGDGCPVRAIAIEHGPTG